MSIDARVMELLDRAEINEVIVRFTRGEDVGDLQLVRNCLADDVQFQYYDDAGNIHALEGADAVVDMVRSLPGASAIGLDRMETSTHLIAHVEVLELDGDHARSETPAVSFLSGPKDGEPITLIRGLRYYDQLVRRDGAWKMQRRRTKHEWMSRAVGMDIHG